MFTLLDPLWKLQGWEHYNDMEKNTVFEETGRADTTA